MAKGIDIAYSPCPNDTFTYGAWALGLVGKAPQVTLADIQELNELALAGKPSLCKVSCAILPQLSPTYHLMPIGAALGRGYGPKLVANRPGKPRLVAVPGRHTTAHLLLNRYFPNVEKRFCLYHEATGLIHAGAVDAALIIHEQRFTYQKEGLVELADLGTLWEKETNLPLPLGCLVAKHGLDFTEVIRSSLLYARAHPEAIIPYIREHAQEMEKSIIDSHIGLYVNEDTLELSPQGYKAIQVLHAKTTDRFCPSA